MSCINHDDIMEYNSLHTKHNIVNIHLLSHNTVYIVNFERCRFRCKLTDIRGAPISKLTDIPIADISAIKHTNTDRAVAMNSLLY